MLRPTVLRLSWAAAAGAAFAGFGLGAASGAGCGSSDASPSSSGGGSSTASTTTSSSADTTTSTSSAASTSATTGAGGAGGGSQAATTTTTTTASAGGAGGSAGAGGAAPWPTCDAQPPGSALKTLHEIWQDDPVAPTPVWVQGVFVTAVSQSQCADGSGCQIFVQQAESFADLAAGAQQALKVFASPSTAGHFDTIAVGDRVDVYANAWRYTVDGQHELLLQVNLQYPGCMKKVGAGHPVPVAATLDDLTLSAYEDTLGPLLVQLSGVSGKAHMPAETFALYEKGVFSEAGIEDVVSLSPFFLPGAAFTGLPDGVTIDFTTVTGVFGLFVPVADPIVKYKEVYPRTMDDLVH